MSWSHSCRYVLHWDGMYMLLWRGLRNIVSPLFLRHLKPLNQTFFPLPIDQTGAKHPLVFQQKSLLYQYLWPTIYDWLSVPKSRPCSTRQGSKGQKYSWIHLKTHVVSLVPSMRKLPPRIPDIKWNNFSLNISTQCKSGSPLYNVICNTTVHHFQSTLDTTWRIDIPTLTHSHFSWLKNVKWKCWESVLTYHYNVIMTCNI